MARLRLARARAAEIVQEHKIEEAQGEQEKEPSSTGGQQQQKEAASVPPPTSSRLLLGRRSFKSRRQQQQQQQPRQQQQKPPLPHPPSHAALWLSRTWPGLASYSSRVARRRCAKGLPPPALPPAILRQATLQKSRSVDSDGRGLSAADGGSLASSSGSALSKTPSLPSSLLLTTPHGRGLVSGNDIFYDARGGSILTGENGGENGSINGSCGGGGVTSEMLRALAAEVEQQMAEEERAAAAALKSSSGGAVKKATTAAVDDSEDEDEEEGLDDDGDGDDDDDEERGGEKAAASSSSSAPDCASALVLSREPGWHSALFRPTSRRLRQGLPPICETGRRPSMWSLICSLFGKASHDLHSVSVPAHFNEPLTETQRHVEIMQHSHLLDAAATYPPESPARLLAVFGFACSLVSTCVRTSKPFKDLQGGTFEMVADDDDDEEEHEAEGGEREAGSGSSGGPAPRKRGGRRFRALAEKVQHSPPVVAFCVQGERWTFEAHDELHVELSLRGLKMHPRGACRLTFIDEETEEKQEKKEQQGEEEESPSSPPPLPLLPKKPDEYRWNTPAFYVRDIVPSGSPGHMMRVCHKGPFFAKCIATGDAVVAVAAEAEGRAARAAAARGRGLMSSVSGRYEPGPGRPAFAAEISGRLDGVVTARVRREHTQPCSSSPSSSPSPSSSSLLGCDPGSFDGGGGRGFSGHAREALAAWNGDGGEEGNNNTSGGNGDGGGGRRSGDSDSSSSTTKNKSPFILLPLFRGTTAHHRSQRGCGPWGMSPWACSLNDCPDDLLAALPVTDARRRRDVALVERGDGDAADAEKERMEARQRLDRAAAARALREWREARRRERGRRRARRAKEEDEGGGDGGGGGAAASAVAARPPPTAAAAEETPDAVSKERPRPFGAPRWFHSVPGTDVWGNPYSRWVYSGGYWEAREKREWPRGTRDPYA